MYYNNTIYNTGDFYNSSPGVVFLDSKTGKYTQHNQWVNNIWHTYVYQGFKLTAGMEYYVINNQFRRNILYPNGGAAEVDMYGSLMTLASAKAAYSSEFSGFVNDTADPNYLILPMEIFRFKAVHLRLMQGIG